MNGPRAAPTLGVKSGTAFVLGLGLFLALGLVFYAPYLPERWLRDFSGEIARRAAPDPTPPESDDVRQVQRREPAPHPYICARDVIRTPWDRLVIVGAKTDILAHPLLAGAPWGRLSRDEIAARMRSDERYQLVVLMQDGAVVDAQLFFTFWGDLSAIARPAGYARAEAVFSAYSDDGRYFVAPAAGAPGGVCKTP